MHTLGTRGEQEGNHGQPLIGRRYQAAGIGNTSSVLVVTC